MEFHVFLSLIARVETFLGGFQEFAGEFFFLRGCSTATRNKGLMNHRTQLQRENLPFFVTPTEHPKEESNQRVPLSSRFPV